MANPEHVEIVNRGAAKLAEWQKGHPNVTLDLSDASFADINLSGADLTCAIMSGVNLVKVNLSNATLLHADLKSASLRDINCEKSVLFLADWTNAKVSNSNLTGVDLRNTTLDNTIFSNVDLAAADLSSCKLSNAKFIQCNMSSISLQWVTVNSDTSFVNLVDIRDGVIDRYTIACLGKGRGGLSDGNLMVMKIHDDVARLRSEFSGIWGIIHLLAIFAFCVPYVRFLVENRIEASFSIVQPEKSMTLLDALLRYIWNGGVDWKKGFYLDKLSFGIFVVFLVYNTVRISLLYKTKKLETQQEVSGVPCDFSLNISFGWWIAFWLCKIGLIAYLICAVLNVYHFLQMRIPI